MPRAPYAESVTHHDDSGDCDESENNVSKKEAPLVAFFYCTPTPRLLLIIKKDVTKTINAMSTQIPT